MVIRRCPQCRGTTDDQYGFCIKCGYEFEDTNNKENGKICIKCGKHNPEEATHCVNCGTSLAISDLFKDYEIVLQPSKPKPSKTSNFLIALGYICTIFIPIVGLIISLYLLSRKDPKAKKHALIQIALFIALFVLTTLFTFLVMNGTIDLTKYLTPEQVELVKQAIGNNATVLNNLTQLK